MHLNWKKCQPSDPDYVDSTVANTRWWAPAVGHPQTPGYLATLPGPSSQDNDGHYWSVTRVSDSNVVPERFVAAWVHPTATAPSNVVA